MSYQVGANDPLWTFDVLAFEKFWAEYAKTRVPPITTNAEKDAFINGASQAVMNDMLRTFLRSMRAEAGIIFSAQAQP
jgi:hypothetical protein